MKKIAFVLLSLALSIFIGGCSNDDDNTDNSPTFENLTATVIKQISCQTTGNGFVYEIELDEAISINEMMLSAVGITNISDDFKAEGTRIRLNIRQTEFPDGACVTLYSSEYFFENTQISLIP